MSEQMDNGMDGWMDGWMDESAFLVVSLVGAYHIYDCFQELV